MPEEYGVKPIPPEILEAMRRRGEVRAEPIEVEPEPARPSFQERIEEEVSLPEEKDELSDLFEVPETEDNDMKVDHLVARPEEEDLGDLVDVDFGRDIMGDDEEPEPQPTKRFRIAPKGRRFIRRQTPPTSLGGLRVG